MTEGGWLFALLSLRDPYPTVIARPLPHCHCEAEGRGNLDDHNARRSALRLRPQRPFPSHARLPRCARNDRGRMALCPTVIARPLPYYHCETPTLLSLRGRRPWQSRRPQRAALRPPPAPTAVPIPSRLPRRARNDRGRMALCPTVIARPLPHCHCEAEGRGNLDDHNARRSALRLRPQRPFPSHRDCRAALAMTEGGWLFALLSLRDPYPTVIARPKAVAIPTTTTRGAPPSASCPNGRSLPVGIAALRSQ